MVSSWTVLVGITLTCLCLDLTLCQWHGPCYQCELFNIMNQKHPDRIKHENISECHYPCQCPVSESNCNEGVNRVKDGCNCCYMCARQHGDLCNMKEKCDKDKGLFCDTRGNKNNLGTCRAYVPKPCVVDSKTYGDGQQFKPDCTRLCTCQNGNYGCINLCSQENRKPSEQHCRNPQLVVVKGRCCKEWTCDSAARRPKIARQIGDRHKIENEVHPHGSQRLMMRDSYKLNRVIPATQAVTMPTRPVCQIKATTWSPCSVSCGVGMSARVSNDNDDCIQRQQIRICYLRPCGKVVTTLGRKKCTPTTRSNGVERINFQDCRSVKELSLRFCTNCKRNRCCYPKYTKMRRVEFECSSGRRETMDFLWIRKCQCSRECYAHEAVEF